MDTVKELMDIVGEKNVRTDLPERLCYSRDLSVHEAVPDVIVFAKTAEDISKILSLANREKIPVTPRGSGTSAVGGALAAKGGILSNGARVIDIIRTQIVILSKKEIKDIESLPTFIDRLRATPRGISHIRVRGKRI